LISRLTLTSQLIPIKRLFNNIFYWSFRWIGKYEALWWIDWENTLIYRTLDPLTYLDLRHFAHWVRLRWHLLAIERFRAVFQTILLCLNMFIAVTHTTNIWWCRHAKLNHILSNLTPLLGKVSLWVYPFLLLSEDPFHLLGYFQLFTWLLILDPSLSYGNRRMHAGFFLGEDGDTSFGD
jgi:hypothetical protein